LLRLKFFNSFVVLLILSSSLFAQSGTLGGTVTDQTGAIIPDATVTISGPGGAIKTAKADSAGEYAFNALAAGDYTVQAAAPDLKLLKPAKIRIGQTSQTLDLQLQIVTAEQRIEVEEEAATITLTPENNASALVMRGSDLDALADDADELRNDLRALAGPSAGPSGGAIYIDGFSGGELPTKDAIREIRINQNPFSPQYDKLGLGRIEVFTKPGADQWRGNFFQHTGSTSWNSRNPYAAAKSPFFSTEYSGQIGGPLNKRASFLVSGRSDSFDNGLISNGYVLSQSAFAITPFNSVTKEPQRRFVLGPRLDYRINQNNTLTLRYQTTINHIHNSGVGSFDLASRGVFLNSDQQTFQVIETAVLSTKLVMDTRFQFFRSSVQQTPNSFDPALLVLGAFKAGGAQTGHSFNHDNNYEFQNYENLNHGKHAWNFGVRLRGETIESILPQNFGGTFTFSGGLAPQLDANNRLVTGSDGSPALQHITAIEQFRRTLFFQQQGLLPPQIRALGGGASQFSIAAGAPNLSVGQMDAGIFAGDDWRLRPNVTLSFGVRYELQSNISNRNNMAPRVGIAWAPGAATQGQTATVIRAGFGLFYDRFPLSGVLAAERFNGIVQQQFVVTNPDFFPSVPVISALAGLQSTHIIQQIDPHARAPYIMQTAITVDRQLARGNTISLTYTNSHGLHQLRFRDLNAPLPGTFDPTVALSGVYPLGNVNPVFSMESSGLYNQDQLIVNVNSKIGRALSLFGSYDYGRAKSNTDGINTFPANPYDFSGEYGPASTDVRHRELIGGTIDILGGFRLNPYINIQSGAPFDITAGRDLYGDTLFNGRPAFASDPNKPGLISTAYGLLDPDPIPGEKLVPRNYGRGPALYFTNLRIIKTLTFGREGKVANNAAARHGLFASLFPGPPADRGYKVTIGFSTRNILNHTNPGPIIGNISSPLFGRSNALSGGLPGTFLSDANNRTTEIMTTFSF
jgi:hypothetical protein